MKASDRLIPRDIIDSCADLLEDRGGESQAGYRLELIKMRNRVANCFNARHRGQLVWIASSSMLYAAHVLGEEGGDSILIDGLRKYAGELQ